MSSEGSCATYCLGRTSAFESQKPEDAQPESAISHIKRPYRICLQVDVDGRALQFIMIRAPYEHQLKAPMPTKP